MIALEYLKIGKRHLGHFLILEHGLYLVKLDILAIAQPTETS